MIIDILLLIILAYGLLKGLTRGGVLQLFSLIGFIVALIVARIYAPDLGNIISSIIPSSDPETDNAVWTMFYNAVGFALLFFIVQLVIRKIASMLNLFTKLPVIGFLNRIVGAILGFVQMYLVAFVIILLLFLTPIGNTKALVEESNLAMEMLNSTPVLSDFFKTMF